MADETNTSNQQSTDQGFVTKQVQTPADLSVAMSPAQSASFIGGLKTFYQANKFYFWAIVVGSLTIAVLAYFAFRQSPSPTVTEANVSLSVSVPETLQSGREAVYKITVTNNDNQKLVNLQLELAYPPGITYIGSSPNASNLSGSLFGVPDLIAGQNAVVFVKTKAVGNIGEQKTLSLKLRYKYANFNSEFIKNEASTVTLSASDVSLELEGPVNTNNAQLVVYGIKYKNNSEGEVKNARIKINYPDGFVFASSAPLPSLGSDTWDIGALAKGSQGTIQIQGTFTATSPGESKIVEAKFLILGSDGQFFTQNSANFTTAISSLPLLISQELDPDSGGVISPGGNLNFRVRYQNNASTAANGLNITVNLDSKVVDLSSIRAEGGQINNNIIIWNAASVAQLERLAPNESGQLSFSLKINNPAARDSSKNLTLVSDIKIKSNEYDSFFPGNQLTLKVSSPAVLTGALSFVSGQLPPQVGRTTIYKVRLAFSNSSNDFSNGELTAFIPLGAGGFVSSSLTSKEAGNAQFDSSTGKLSWNVGNLPAHAGRFSSSRFLDFQVTLQPSAAQANASPVLVKDINFSAKDSFTSEDIILTARDITTSSLSEENGYSYGRVVP